MTPIFQEFGKIARLNRAVVVTEKIDGTNACVIVGEDGSVAAQSRNRIITPDDDNYGFARWVAEHAAELAQLGAGHHFGEWWGQGIQRGYGLTERRFSLFNVTRWSDPAARPACCHVVPVIGQGIGFGCVDMFVAMLRQSGSQAAPGWPTPEGVVAFHEASNKLFKVTLENDGYRKGEHLKAADAAEGRRGNAGAAGEATAAPSSSADRSEQWFRVRPYRRLGDWMVDVTDSVQRLLTPHEAHALARQLIAAADAAEGGSRG